MRHAVDGHLAHLRRGWSTLVKTHDCRLGQRIEVELEADGRRRRVRCHRQVVGADRKHCEEGTGRGVTRRWGRTAITRCAEVRTSLKRPLWQLSDLWVTGIESKLVHLRGDVHHQPVPESATSGCIRIEAGNSEDLGAGGCPRPSEVRRFVAAFTAEAVIRRQNVVLSEVAAVLKVIAPDRKLHTLPPVLPQSKPMWLRS